MSENIKKDLDQERCMSLLKDSFKKMAIAGAAVLAGAGLMALGVKIGISGSICILESGGIAHEALAEAWKIGSKALSK